MYKLDELLKQWKIDGKIDEIKLDDSSIATAKLHGKYLEYYMNAQRFLRGLEFKHKSFLKDKFLWHLGKLPQEKIEEYGWKPNPFDRLTLTKSQQQYFIDADEDLQREEARIEEAKLVVDALKEIIDHIKWRHQSIRNAIDWRRFNEGG